MSIPVDGVAAAATLLSWGVCDPGYCLHYVWQAYKAHGASCGETYPTAYAAWLGSGGKHEGDWNPPPGVPVYFGPRDNSSAGDVVISTGGGMCNATDWPYSGVIGSCSLAERQAQIGRPYLGWTDNILNYPIALGDNSGTGPLLGWDDDMATYIISYASETRNGIYLAAPGYWHQFTDEEWTQFTNHGMRGDIYTVVPVNDRDFDVLKQIFVGG